MSEKLRLHRRMNCDIDARIDWAEGERKATIKNITLVGCYIESSIAMDLGAFVRLSATITPNRRVHLQGRVVYTKPGHGFALRFEAHTRADRNAIIGVVLHVQETSPDMK